MDGDKILRALDRAGYEEWEDAAAALDGENGALPQSLRTFFSRMAARDRARATAISTVRHDLANAMSIALANLEGMADGAVSTTPARLNNVCETLRGIRGLLDRLRGTDSPNTEQ